MREKFKQKRILFPLIFLSQFVTLTVIARIFGLETENSLYGDISIFIMFSTFGWFLFRIIKDHKQYLISKNMPFDGYPVLWMIYFAIFIIIVGLIYIAFMILFEIVALMGSGG